MTTETQEMTTETQTNITIREPGSIIDVIEVDTIADRMTSDDPMVRLEAKLDYVINVTANMGEGMSTAMEQIQDSPIGRMLGNALGINNRG